MIASSYITEVRAMDFPYSDTNVSITANHKEAQILQAQEKLKKLENELKELLLQNNPSILQYAQEESPRLFNYLEQLNNELSAAKSQQHKQVITNLKNRYLQSQQEIEQALDRIYQEFESINEKQKVCKAKLVVAGYIESGNRPSVITEEYQQYYEQYEQDPAQFDIKLLEQQWEKYQQEKEELIRNDEHLREEQQRILNNKPNYHEISIGDNSIIKNIKKQYASAVEELRDIESLAIQYEGIDKNLKDTTEKIQKQKARIRNLNSIGLLELNVVKEPHHPTISNVNTTHESESSDFSFDVLKTKLKFDETFNIPKYTISYDIDDEAPNQVANSFNSNKLDQTPSGIRTLDCSLSQSSPVCSTPKKNNNTINFLQSADINALILPPIQNIHDSSQECDNTFMKVRKNLKQELEEVGSVFSNTLQTFIYHSTAVRSKEYDDNIPSNYSSSNDDEISSHLELIDNNTLPINLSLIDPNIQWPISPITSPLSPNSRNKSLQYEFNTNNPGPIQDPTNLKDIELSRLAGYVKSSQTDLTNNNKNYDGNSKDTVDDSDHHDNNCQKLSRINKPIAKQQNSKLFDEIPQIDINEEEEHQSKLLEIDNYQEYDGIAQLFRTSEQVDNIININDNTDRALNLEGISVDNNLNHTISNMSNVDNAAYDTLNSSNQAEADQPNPEVTTDNNIDLTGEQNSISNTLTIKQYSDSDATIVSQQVSLSQDELLQMIHNANHTLLIGYVTQLVSNTLINNIIDHRINFFSAVAAGDEEKTKMLKGFWISTLYGASRFGMMQNMHLYNGNNYGTIMGFDIELNEKQESFGIAYSNIHSHFKFTGSDNKKISILGHGVTLYHHKDLNSNWTLQSVLATSRNYITNKAVCNIACIKYDCYGKYKSTHYNVGSKLNYKIITNSNVLIVPSAGIRHSNFIIYLFQFVGGFLVLQLLF